VIEIWADGYEPAKQPVTIAAKKTFRIPVNLNPIQSPPPQPPPKGTLVLDVTPSAAILTLDGNQIGPAKDFHQELQAGTYIVELSAEGYEPAKQTVTIVAGEALRVPVKLNPIPPPVTKGTLALDVTPPGAILTLDGRQIGPAGNFHQELSPGTHEFELSAIGYEPAKQTVTIVTGETLRVAVKLNPIPPPPTKGTLVLAVTPPGAILTLDGKQIGPAKDFRQELSAGAHEIELSAEEYEPIKRTVNIAAGETLQIPLSLAARPPPPPQPTPKGTLVLDVRPRTANLRIDGEQVELVGGSLRRELLAGDHEIEVTAEGYQRALWRVSINPERENPASVDLTPFPGILDIRVNPANATVTIDGRKSGAGSRKIPVNPGDYLVGADAKGFEHKEARIHVDPGKPHPVELALKQRPQPSRPNNRATDPEMTTSITTKSTPALTGLAPPQPQLPLPPPPPQPPPTPTPPPPLPRVQPPPS
jgi:hypothetical protein